MAVEGSGEEGSGEEGSREEGVLFWGGGCGGLVLLEWKGILEGWWMCVCSFGEAALTKGTVQGRASMLIGRLNGIKLSEREDRMNMMQLITMDEVVGWGALELDDVVVGLNWVEDGDCMYVGEAVSLDHLAKVQQIPTKRDALNEIRDHHFSPYWSVCSVLVYQTY